MELMCLDLIEYVMYSQERWSGESTNMKDFPNCFNAFKFFIYAPHGLCENVTQHHRITYERMIKKLEIYDGDLDKANEEIEDFRLALKGEYESSSEQEYESSSEQDYDD